MKKGLVIVESPTKVRTLKRYLGKDFDVRASVGHIKDLPKKRLGVDVEHDFSPEYEIIRGKGQVLKDLKAAAAQVEDIYLAPDPDREGEAIAWHIAEELQDKKKTKRFHRVLFHELTQRAIEEAIRTPGVLDQHKFESQQARRILDRLVGYEISPILWDKVKRGLSAGRVQSVAVRMICEREREIQAFIPEEYWSITAACHGPAPPPFEARAVAHQGKKLSISEGEQAHAAAEEIRKHPARVQKIETKTQRRHPAPPFITSTLQQEAARKLRFPAKKTMRLAQSLYEGIDLGQEGPVGLITYMRTDSTRLAQEATDEARAYIAETYGRDYLPAKPPSYKRGKLAQDAHEAIRPTSVTRTPQEVQPFLDKDALALYELIWKRLVASQMASAVLDQTRADIAVGPYELRATGTVVRFKGFTTLYSEDRDETVPSREGSTDKGELPVLHEGDVIDLKSVEPKQHFTQPPPRYTEASLIKTLEEKGIGRPSTYATILSNIQDKEYVRLAQRHFIPTELGLLITDLLVAHFPEILDTAFTADLEKELDQVEEGQTSWTALLGQFYAPFHQRLRLAKQEMRSVKAAGVPTEVTCDKCASPMVIKYGKSGEFLACSAYPTCKNTANFTRDDKGKVHIVEDKDQPTSEVCDKCQRPMVIKKGRFGEFLACSGYPECRNTKPISTGVPCPQPDCTGELVQRRSRSGKTFYGCNRYPGCTFATWDPPVARECPQCGSKVLVLKTPSKGPKQLQCPDKKCRYRTPAEDF